MTEGLSRRFLKHAASVVRSAGIALCYNRAGSKSFLTINNESNLEGNS